MRILILTPYLSFPPEHGGKIRSFHLFSALLPRHNVWNLSGLAPTDRPEDVAALEALGLRVEAYPLAPASGSLSAGERAKKVWHLLAGRSSLPPRHRERKLLARFRELCQESWDLLILDHIWMTSYLRERLPAPLVYSAHNLESAILRQQAQDLRSPLQRWLTRLEAHGLEREEKRLLARASLTIVPSARDQQSCQTLVPKARLAVIPNGVDLKTHPQLQAPSWNPLRLLYVGGFDYPPNLQAARRLVFDILPLLQEELPNTSLILAGRDPQGELRSCASRPGVRVAGHVQDLVALYRESSLLIAPLQAGGGSRLKILEAWALGRPVVTTPIGAAGLAAKPGEHLLLAERPEAFVTALHSLIEHPSLVQQLIAAGRKKVEQHHDWPKLGQRFAHLLEELHQTPRPSGCP